MIYNVLDVSRHIINYSEEKDYGVSNLKLQKLLYFVQAYFMLEKKDHTPCFHEKIEAWDFGPVVPEAYQEWAKYGSCDIPQHFSQGAHDFSRWEQSVIESYMVIDKDNIWNSYRVQYHDDIIDEDDKKLIDRVIDRFADYTATDLVSLTLCQRPWMDTYVEGQNNEITTDAIRRYFSAAK